MPNQSSNFTPEQIAEILELFFENMAHRQYIGARYVPIFGRKDETSIEWDGGLAPYEPLTIVLYQGNSYTSRQFVPTGIDINNADFWAETGNYNAQIEQYRQEVLNVAADIADINERLTADITDINKEIDDIALNIVDLEKFANSHTNAGTIDPVYIGDFLSDYQFSAVCKKENLFYCFVTDNYNTNQPVYVFDIANNNKYQTINNKPLGHANSSAYNSDEDKIYIALYETYNQGVQTDSNKIVAYNTSFTTVNEYEFAYKMQSVSFDNVNHKLYAFSSIANGIIHVYQKIENDFEEIGQINTSIFDYFTSDINLQDFAVNDDIVYLETTTGNVYIFDIGNLKNCINTFNISVNDQSGYWVYGEPEGIEFAANGILYGANCFYFQKSQKNYNANYELTNGFVYALNCKNISMRSTNYRHSVQYPISISPSIQDRFSLFSNHIRSLNQLACIRTSASEIRVYQNVVENSRVFISPLSMKNITLNITPNASYSCVDLNFISSCIFALNLQSTANLIFTATSSNTDHAIETNNVGPFIILRLDGTITKNVSSLMHINNVPPIIAVQRTSNQDDLVVGNNTLTDKRYFLMGNNIIFSSN